MQTQPKDIERVVSYRRVSSKEQVDNNSLGIQKRDNDAYIAKNTWERVEEFKDEGESAKTADRPGLQQMLLFCTAKKNRIDAVVIHKIDRLARNADDFTAMRTLLAKHGVRIISVNEPITEDAVGKFTQSMLAIVAEFDNDIRTWRATSGMKAALAEGRWVWDAPIGFENVHADATRGIKKTVKPHETSRECVRAAFELMDTRKYTVEEAYTLCTASENERRLVKKNGKVISLQYFHYMLRNKLYIGIMEVFGEKYDGTFERVISPDLFNRVQEVLRRNGTKNPPHKRDNPLFPLRRFATTLEGAKYSGSICKGKYPKYHLGGKGKTYSKDDFEKGFAKLMDTYRFDAADTAKLKRYVREEFDIAVKDTQKDIERSQKRIQELADLQSNLVRKNAQGIVSDRVLKEELDRIDTERTELDVSLAMQRMESPKVEDSLALAEQFLTAPSEVWKESGLDTQTKLQWFQFPRGATFDGNSFGTPEVSFLFKEKDAILSSLSNRVHPLGFEPRTMRV